MALTKVTSGLISADASSVDLNIDAGTLYIDATNNKVGIGTTSPATPLQVVSTAGDWTADIKNYSTDAYGLRIDLSGSTGTAFAQATYTATGTGFFVKNNGNVGIGTSSPAVPLDINIGTNNNGLYIRSTDRYSNIGLTDNTGSIKVGSDNGAMFFEVGGDSSFASLSEAMRIDSSGNVGIGDGTISHTSMLHIYKSLATADLALQSAGGSGRKHILQSNTDGSLAFYDNNASSERMRIDSSGNLLVGKSSTSSGVVGHRFNPDGSQESTTDGGLVAYFNRKTSDGQIARFDKDGSEVGSINVEGSELAIGTTTAGLQFLGSEARIRPFNISSNAPTDNTIDLGRSNTRFQDIYATNGTIQTSDRNEKQDIEDLSEAETRVAVVAKGLLKKYRWKSAVEEKGDEARIHFGIIAQDLQDAFTAEGLDASNYAMFCSDTWTDEETGEEKTRLGVRYHELLAFIIAGI